MSETCTCGHPKSHHWHDRRVTPRRRATDAHQGVPTWWREGPGKCLSFNAPDCRCGRYIPAPEVSGAR